MEFPLDADVHCSDGRCGRSTYVVLNPATEEISHVVVQGKRPSRTERLVPVQLIEKTAAEMILLNCTLAEFANLEPFNQTEFVYTDLPHHARDPSLTLLWPYVVPTKRTVDRKIRAIPPGELAVRRGARVRATDGRVGRVDEFVVDPDGGNITHLGMREGHLWGNRLVCIPVNHIDHIEESVVHLKIDKETIASLPSIPVKRRWA